MRGQTKQRYSIFINLLIILAIMAIVNFLAADYFIRFDLTENKTYSVTRSTKKILRRLDDLVSIKVYCSKKLPPQLEQLAREIRDTLEEYEAYARGNLQIEWIDPAEDEEEKAKVRRLGIPQLTANIIEKDKHQVINIYLGIGIFYADRKEIIPAIQSVSNLEYELTSAILKVMTGQLRKIYFLSGHNEHDINNDYSTLRSALSNNYEVSTIDTSKGQQVPEDVDTLMVAGPTELAERDKYEVDQFLMKGKNVFFLIDSIHINQQVSMPIPRKHKLDDMLTHYGIKLKPDLVVDARSHSRIRMGSQFMTFITNYPLWPLVVHQNMAPEQPITNRLQTVAFPWTSSIEIMQDRIPGMKIVELLKTTEHSWTQQEGSFNIDPQRLPRPQPSELKQHLLAAIIRGKFKSFYADKPIPPPKGDQGTAPIEAEPDRQTIKECINPGTILVIGDSDFIANDMLSGREGNVSFILNAFDWATMGGDLIGIRAKQVPSRPLKETSTGTKLLCKVLNIGLVPCLFILYGLLRFFLRQRDKKLVD